MWVCCLDCGGGEEYMKGFLDYMNCMIKISTADLYFLLITIAVLMFVTGFFISKELKTTEAKTELVKKLK